MERTLPAMTNMAIPMKIMQNEYEASRNHESSHSKKQMSNNDLSPELIGTMRGTGKIIKGKNNLQSNQKEYSSESRNQSKPEMQIS